MHVTVAICTWNRAALLEKTLAQLTRLTVPSDASWELLVVNNCCTDATEEVLARYQPRLPLRRLFEPEPGLSNARNCALQAAQGEWLLWTDDDVLVEPDWLAAYAAAAERYPQTAFFGGPIRPWFEIPPPDWVRAALPKLDGVFAMRDLGTLSFEMDDETLPFGANFAVRTSLLRQYRFDPQLGRIQGGMLSGEETGLLRQMLADGHIGRWVPSAVVQHFVPKERLTLQYARRFFVGIGRTNVMMGERFAQMKRRRVWREYVKAEAKFRALAFFQPPSKWIAHFIRSSYLRGVLIGQREQRCGQRAAA
jgi:hypothetical protein